MTLGILGGTFDPPHFGHLLLGECARVQFGLERILFLPAGDPYRKTARAVTPASHRLAMTRIATAANLAFAVDDLEIRRTGPTYTIDTLEALHARGATELVLVLGSDALADLPNWKDHTRLQDLATIAIASKALDAATVATLAREAGLRETPALIEMPPVAISGTVIRARVAAGLPVRYLLPDAVLDYIAEHRLYLPG
ncbi:MAG: nicotinate-nucleotide adenylyltransferase [Tepidiformaceae bacterium]